MNGKKILNIAATIIVAFILWTIVSKRHRHSTGIPTRYSTRDSWSWIRIGDG